MIISFETETRNNPNFVSENLLSDLLPTKYKGIPSPMFDHTVRIQLRTNGQLTMDDLEQAVKELRICFD